MTSESSSSSSNANNSAANKELEAKFEELMAEGKRCFFCGEFEQASDIFAEGCRIKDELCGESSHHSAEVYYHYGTSMLELARSEQGVLGEKAIQKDDLAEDSDDEDPPEEEAPQENKNDDQEEEEEEEEEEISNMQLAWEMLELARTLYHKKELTTEVYTMIAKCSEKLGDLGLEIENYQQTVLNMQDCIEIYKKILPENDRKFASAYYCLGMAYSEMKKFADSHKSYLQSIQVLDRNVLEVKEKLSKAEDEKDSLRIDKLTEELKEFEVFLTEINHRIEDMKDLKKRATSSQAATSSNGAGSSSSSSAGSSSSSSAGPSSSSAFNVPEQEPSPTTINGSATSSKVDDISHLIRRKRCSDGSEAKLVSTNGCNTNTKSPEVTKKRRIQL